MCLTLHRKSYQYFFKEVDQNALQPTGRQRLESKERKWELWRLTKWRSISPTDKICQQIRTTTHETWEHAQIKREKWLEARRYGTIQGWRYLLLLAGTQSRNHRSSGLLIIQRNRNQRLGLIQGDNISHNKRNRERVEKRR